MVARYGLGPYNINLYSLESVFVDDITMTGAFVLTAAAAIFVAGDITIAGVFTLNTAAAILAAGDALVSGLFSIDAANTINTQITGDATVTAAFSLSALGSAVWAEPLTAIAASFVINMEYFAGDFWNPELPAGYWIPEPPLPGGIWVKEIPGLIPWRY